MDLFVRLSIYLSVCRVFVTHCATYRLSSKQNEKIADRPPFFRGFKRLYEGSMGSGGSKVFKGFIWV